jgi:hypothetical protein
MGFQGHPFNKSSEFVRGELILKITILPFAGCLMFQFHLIGIVI